MPTAVTSPARPCRGDSRRRGVTLTDLCAVLATVMLLAAVAVPSLAGRSREQANRIKCASNLRQIAMAAIMYAGQDTRNNGKFPRTYFDPATAGTPALYTGTDSRQSFAADPNDPTVPRPNDPTAAFYLLLKTSDLTSDVFNCPEDDAVTRFEGDVAAKSNWPGGPKQLSYSYNNPYPIMRAVQAGWKFDTTLSPDHPLAADMNYGDNPKGGPTKVPYTAGRQLMASANSANHWFEGQQVVYADAHVEWQTSPFAGAPKSGRAWRDNIYASAAGVNEQTGVGGATHGGPVEPTDSVLLPTAVDVPAGAAAAAVVRQPGMRPPSGPDAAVVILGGVLLLTVLGVVLFVLLRRKPVPAYPGAYQPGMPPPGYPPQTGYPPGGYPPAGTYPTPVQAGPPPLPPPAGGTPVRPPPGTGQ